jgi:phosphomannomutase/phosphoglucomutase
VLAEEITKLGGRALMCKTGHSFVEEMMERSGALLGGEVSGHLFFAENYYGYDDALLAAYKLITILWNSGKPIAEHLVDIPKTHITPEIKVRVAEEYKFEVMKPIDGIRIDFAEGAWGIIRASNTSPYLTTRFEARSDEKLKEIQKIVFDYLKEYDQIRGVPEM